MKRIFVAGLFVLFSTVGHAECGGAGGGGSFGRAFFSPGPWMSSPGPGAWMSAEDSACGSSANAMMMDDACGSSGGTALVTTSCGASSYVSTANRAIVYLSGIPSGAKLTILGKDYSISGQAPRLRTFITRPLAAAGYTLTFVVSYLANTGKMVTGKLDLPVYPGQQVEVSRKNFTLVPNAEVPVEPPLKDPLKNSPSPEQDPIQPPSERDPLNPSPTGGSLKPSEKPALIDLREMPDAARIFVREDLVSDERDGANRMLRTPPLKVGKRYKYDLRIEYPNADGEMISQGKVVFITGGEHYRLDLDSFFNRVAVRGAEKVVPQPIRAVSGRK